MPNHQIKIIRASKIAKLLPMAEREIMQSISAELIHSLTSKQLAQVMRNLNAHWHKAQAAARAAEKADGAYWLEDRLIPAEVIRAIEIEETVETAPVTPTKHFPQAAQRWTNIKYTVNHTERF